jgi:ABC-type transport system involved in multi-copper enzyme maturation permease subunit
MFGNLIQIEQTKLFKRIIFWVELAILCGLLLFIYGVLFAQHLTPDAPAEIASAIEAMLTWPGALISILSIVSGNSLGGILVIVLAGVIVAQEYQWNTVALWLSRGAPRPLLLAARCAVLFLGAVLIVVVPLLFGGIITAVLTAVINGSLDLSVVNYGQLALGAIRALIAALPYFAFTIMMAVITRSVAGGIGTGIGFTFVLDGILAQILQALGAEKVTAFFPGNLGASLMQLNAAIANLPSSVQNGDAGQASSMLLDPTAALMVIGLYTVVFLGFAFYWFQRQDLSA